MNKTDDIEYAILMALRGGPRTLAEMEARLPGALRAEDRRWIGVAVSNMLDDGRIRTTACATGHDHNDACVVART